MKLMPGMTANISFLLEARENVLRVPAGALRFVPPANRAHLEDRHYLDGPVADSPQSGARLSASQKAALGKGRSRRIVWVQEGPWLRAVPVTLGLIDNQFAELIEGGLAEGQDLVTAAEAHDVDLIVVAHPGRREEIWAERDQIGRTLLGAEVVEAHEVPHQRPFRWQAYTADLRKLDLALDEARSTCGPGWPAT